MVRGAAAERLVGEALEQQGWTIIARNWRGDGGEIDLVAERARVVRFVEVKARAPEDPAPEEAVGFGKQQRLIRAADAWLLAHPTPKEACFLVALVVLGADDTATIEWIDNAFDG